jgi:hypothetical protein
MSTSRLTARRFVVLVVTAAVTAASGVITAGVAAADGQSAADDYVAFLLARHAASQPYSQADDYVDTLVYWHHHPRWGFGA